MKTKSILAKLLSTILALCMMLVLLPVTVYAQSSPTVIDISESWFLTTTGTYYEPYAPNWSFFCGNAHLYVRENVTVVGPREASPRSMTLETGTFSSQDKQVTWTADFSASGTNNFFSLITLHGYGFLEITSGVLSSNTVSTSSVIGSAHFDSNATKITVSGGLLENTGAGNGITSAYAAVHNGTVKTNSGIGLRGVNEVNVTGGLVETETGRAIAAYSNDTAVEINISGGIVRANGTDGIGIDARVGTVNLSGGLVSSTTGVTIDAKDVFATGTATVTNNSGATAVNLRNNGTLQANAGGSLTVNGNVTTSGGTRNIGAADGGKLYINGTLTNISNIVISEGGATLASIHVGTPTRTNITLPAPHDAYTWNEYTAASSINPQSYVYVKSGTATTPAPAIAASSTGLGSLKVGQAVSGSIIYTLTNGTYAASINAANFAVSGLPSGLSAGAAMRTSNTVVTVPISGTPTTHNASTSTIILPTSIAMANVTGATANITPTGTVTAGAVAKGTPTAANLTYTIPTTHVYNGNAQGFSVTPNAGAGVGTVTAYFDGSTTVPTNADTYTVTANVAEGANYEAATGIPIGSYTIGKASITITADDKSATVGAEQPVYTYSVSGLASVDALAANPIVDSPDADMDTAGQYDIVPSGAVVPNTNNYNTAITYVNGKLTVSSGGGNDDGNTPGTNPGRPTVQVDIEDEKTPLSDFTSYAEELYKLGLFRGTGTDADGNPIFSLDQPLTRLQALILTIRLLGLEEEALAYNGLNPFNDVTSGVNAAYVSYAYSVGLTRGVSATTFAPNRQVTCQQFTTFMLRALGYFGVDNGNFVYEYALDIALAIDMYDDEILADLDDGVFLRGDAVIAMVRALLTYMKDPFDLLLIEKLVEAGVFPREAADAFIEAIARISND